MVMVWVAENGKNFQIEKWFAKQFYKNNFHYSEKQKQNPPNNRVNNATVKIDRITITKWTNK